MMSEYYSKDDLITVLKSHVLADDWDKINFDSVIENGEIYPHEIEGVNGCYIYYVIGSTIQGHTIFVHPMVCTEVYFDPFQTKEMYMTGNLVITP